MGVVTLTPSLRPLRTKKMDRARAVARINVRKRPARAPDRAQNGCNPVTAASPMTDELDNPFWSALNTRHRHLAIGGDGWARYPAECAPFLGVADAQVDLSAALAPGEQVFLLGVQIAVIAAPIRSRSMATACRRSRR